MLKGGKDPEENFQMSKNYSNSIPQGLIEFETSLLR